MKEQIIQILHDASPHTISGPEISSRIGISRVAVWKHIKQLKEQGYAIESSPNGYRLDHSISHSPHSSNASDCNETFDQLSDLPLPLYFPKREGLIHHFFSLTSTMDSAKKMAREGAPHMSVVIAEKQTAGRGRLRREWLSQKGGLWMTLILRPHLPPPMAWQVNFAASLALAQTLREGFDIQVGVKWPNDILFDDKKVAGLLSELETEGDMVSFVNIGIGLNVNNFPQQAQPGAISLRDILGRPVHRRELLVDFLDRFEKILLDHGMVPCNESSPSPALTNPTFVIPERGGWGSDVATNHSDAVASLISKWKKMTVTIGRRVTIQTFGDRVHGVAEDVDDTGALILRQDDGTCKTIIYGDCFHQSE